MERKFILAPSILAADFGQLNQEIDMINQSEAEWLHVDVMDGHFVPNLSFGIPLVKSMAKASNKLVDVHLMISNPESYIHKYHEAGAEMLTFHYEATDHVHSLAQQIRAMGAKAGCAINPHTPVELLFDVLEDLDMVCIMSVNPGFGGQKFIYRTLNKITRLRNEIDQRNLSTLIEIDGGVGLHNAEKILQAGAHVLVAGSAVFKSDDPIATIRKFKEIEKNSYTV